jgi:hypothetical protein
LGWTNLNKCFCLQLEKYGVWVWKKKVVFCSGYNAPTLFRNLKKRPLTHRECGIHIPKILTAMLHSQDFWIATWHPATRGQSFVARYKVKSSDSIYRDRLHI